ncbi:MAG: SBBP repeat-containing protein [Bryobacteraceae bacterium]
MASAPSPFSTFLVANATLQGMGHDAAGNIYVLGTVTDSPIPGRATSLVAARFDPNATTVAYFVYLGGSSTDQAAAMAVDAQGNAYITGNTTSSDFPVTSGFSGPFHSGAVPFAIKLDPAGAVVYATLFAGAVAALPKAIAVDSSGSVVISGVGLQGYTPTSAVFSPNALDDLFVAKLDPSGTRVLFAALGIGGSQIVIGPQGDIFLAGSTFTTPGVFPPYPTTPGAYQTTFTPVCFPTGMGGGCMLSSPQYVTRLSADGTQLIYSTYLSGPSGASNSGLAVDGTGNAYVTGDAMTIEWGIVAPATDYPYTVTPGAGDRVGMFLTKLDPTGSKLVWSVPQGGSALALDADGNPVVGGYSFTGPTYSAYGPAPPPAGNTPAACLPNGTTVQSSAYVQRFNAQDGSTLATQLLSASVSSSSASAIEVEPDGRILLAGGAYPDVPLSPGVVFSQAAQRTVPGVFLAAFDLSQPAAGPQLGCVNDAATLSLVGPVAPGQLVSLFGYELGPQTGVSGFASNQTSFPTSLANVQVTFDGVPAPLLYVSSSQINAQVPFEVASNASTVMTVSVAPDSAGAYATAATRMFAVAGSSPSLFLNLSAPTPNCSPLAFSFNGFTPLVALNSDGSLNGCGNPAKPGSTVTVFLNGVAAMPNGSFPATGSIAGSNTGAIDSQMDVRGGSALVYDGDVDSLAAGPLFPVPGSIGGLDQLAIQLPGTAASGLQAVSLAVAINGIPAGPLAYSPQAASAIQQAVIVWVEQ